MQEKTVENHLESVRTKLDLPSRNDLVARLFRERSQEYIESRHLFVENEVIVQQELIDRSRWHSLVQRSVTVNHGRTSVSKIQHYNREALTSGTEFTSYELHGRLVESTMNSLSISVSYSLKSPREPVTADIMIRFSPALRPGSTAVYEYEETFSGPPTTLAEVSRAAAEREPDGRAAVVLKRWRIVRDTRYIKRIFLLPREHTPNNVQVHVMADGNLDPDETVRVASGLTVTRKLDSRWAWEIIWEVTNPRVGYLYSLEWRPVEEWP
jgi:hypothetical protein